MIVLASHDLHGKEIWEMLSTYKLIKECHSKKDHNLLNSYTAKCALQDEESNTVSFKISLLISKVLF